MILLLVVAIAIVALVTVRNDEVPNHTAIIASLGALLLLGGLVGGPISRSLALASLRRSNPSALVFLARREPVLVPDIQTYQYRKGNFADIADKWVPAIVDSRGISIWSAGGRPKELLLMEWSELGNIIPAHFSSISGRRRYGVTVDVQPYPLPMKVRVGHSAFGVEGSFDSDGVVATAAAAAALRP